MGVIARSRVEAAARSPRRSHDNSRRPPTKFPRSIVEKSAAPSAVALSGGREVIAPPAGVALGDGRNVDKMKIKRRFVRGIVRELSVHITSVRLAFRVRFTRRKSILSYQPLRSLFVFVARDFWTRRLHYWTSELGIGESYIAVRR